MKLITVACCLLLHLIFAEEKLPEICPQIVSRKAWGARITDFIDYTVFPLDYVIIHHTASDSCDAIIYCSSILQAIQSYHIDSRYFADIAYNFLVDSEGRIYEGRGWHKNGAHTRGYNTKSIGVAFIGNYSQDHPTGKQLKAAQSLLECGVQIQELNSTYKLFGAKQFSSGTTSPGINLFNKIKEWPHFAMSE